MHVAVKNKQTKTPRVADFFGCLRDFVRVCVVHTYRRPVENYPRYILSISLYLFLGHRYQVRLCVCESRVLFALSSRTERVCLLKVWPCFVMVSWACMCYRNMRKYDIYPTLPRL